MLGEKLRNAMEKIKNARFLDDNTLEEAVREIQRALISSDVDVNLVYNLAEEIKKTAKKKPPEGLDRRQYLIKETYQQLAQLLGGSPQPPHKPKKILLLGLFGQGKTTSAAKIAAWYSKRGTNTGLICADVHRPASYEQLKQLSEKADTAFFGIKNEKNPCKIIEKGMRELNRKELLIIDSAGRSALDNELISEIKKVKETLKPDQIWLVLSADIGQLAKTQAKAFHEAVNITGILITKMDSSAKAGSVLAACAETKAPVYFIGTGEKLSDLEQFDATRYLSRVMGYGDLQALLEKATEIKETPEDLLEGEFNLKVFYKQLEATSKMGAMDKIAEMLGLKTALPKEELELTEEKLKRFKIIMDSMTDFELKNPESLTGSRIKRIAKGSGSPESSVRELIRNYRKMKKMFEKMQKYAKKGSFEQADMEKLMKKFSSKKKKKLKFKR